MNVTTTTRIEEEKSRLLTKIEELELQLEEKQTARTANKHTSALFTEQVSMCWGAYYALQWVLNERASTIPMLGVGIILCFLTSI